MTATTVEAAPEQLHHGSDTEHGERIGWADLSRVGFVALCAAAVWFGLWEPFPRISVIGLTGTALGGWPIFREAWENLRDWRMTMELSMTLALLAALVIGQFFTALVITTFVLVAEILEGLTVGRGRRAIRELLDRLPATATVRRAGAVREVPLSDLRVGEVVLVAPGGHIPVDGTVRGGHSFVDQATITGESLPIEKVAGTIVYAGTINQSGALEVTTERLGRDTSFGKIIEAVERAERSRAPVQKTADRSAGLLVYCALACAAVTFLITRDVRSTISVIIVAGACGIAAGTPLAILGAIGRAAREGAVVKGGRHLEALWSVDVVAFDKTGTVTTGRAEVRAIRPAPGVSEDLVLGTAAIVELRSEHPLAKAIVRHAEQRGLALGEPDVFSYTVGQGVTAWTDGEEIVAGNRALLAQRGIPDGPAWGGGERDPLRGTTEVLLARGGRFLGSIHVADTVRPEARAAMRALEVEG